MKRIYILACILGILGFSSCEKFLEVDSTYVIDASDSHLVNATDTIYSVTGILKKLQAIGDRTVLLGEARGDLMTITDATSADLRQVATFNIDDNNKYNRPSDYYAIINNCNYFIAHADTAMKNNRNEYIFRGEYIAVKAIRAWTYLQLVTTYGEVPFVTEPILTEEQAQMDYPVKNIKEVCDYFLDEDGLQDMIYDSWFDFPDYGNIKSIPSRLFFVPLPLVLGDLYLWSGRYEMAAYAYHYYLRNRNGSNGIYPTQTTSAEWTNDNWLQINAPLCSSMKDKSNGRYSEVISVIPTDSIPSEGSYSELRNIFHTSAENNYKVGLVPSQSLKDLSASQNYYYNNGGDVVVSPKTHEDPYKGDLRLGTSWTSNENAVNKATGMKYTSQTIQKYPTTEAPMIRTYRRTLVYLRLAEAINRAGCPRYAYHILATGVNNEIINDSIAPEYPELAELLVDRYGFPGTTITSTNSSYVVITDPESNRMANTIGIHARGCGFTAGRYGADGYEMPYDYSIPETNGDEAAIADSIARQRAYQMDMVERMIMDEEALEFAFEGYRFYDLMRVALRRNDPAFLADRIYRRNGSNPSGISVDLTDKRNWFLNWNGKIGMK